MPQILEACLSSTHEAEYLKALGLRKEIAIGL
jgi:hypothetical protein